MQYETKVMRPGKPLDEKTLIESDIKTLRVIQQCYNPCRLCGDDTLWKVNDIPLCPPCFKGKGELSINKILNGGK